MVSVSSLSLTLSLPSEDLVTPYLGTLMGWALPDELVDNEDGHAWPLRLKRLSLFQKVYFSPYSTEKLNLLCVCAPELRGPTISYGKWTLVIKRTQIHIIYWSTFIDICGLRSILGKVPSLGLKPTEVAAGLFGTLVYAELIKHWHWWFAATQTVTSYEL